MDETIVDFEWDEGKAARNLAKHGITFEVATGVFLDRQRITEADGRFDYDEARFKVIGLSRDGLLTVIITKRGANVRIISARPASQKERRHYGNREVQARSR